MLVLAGDIGDLRNPNLERFFYWIMDNWSHAFYIPGNHDYFGFMWEDAEQIMKELCSRTSVTYLNDCMVCHKSITGKCYYFLGATFWTDLTNHEDICRNAMSEYKYVVGLSPELTTECHKVSRNWIHEIITNIKDPHSSIIVVTHHPPSKRCLSPHWQGDVLNPAFVSNSEDLLEKVDLWICGHTHYNFNYLVGKARLVSNQYGHGDVYRYRSDCYISL